MSRCSQPIAGAARSVGHGSYSDSRVELEARIDLPARPTRAARPRRRVARRAWTAVRDTPRRLGRFGDPCAISHSWSRSDPSTRPRPLTPRGSRRRSHALRAAVAAGVPVLGLCFGGQALSLALGGGVDRARSARDRLVPDRDGRRRPDPPRPMVDVAHRADARPARWGRARAFACRPGRVRVRSASRGPVPSRGRRRARRGLGGADEHLAAVGLTPDDARRAEPKCMRRRHVSRRSRCSIGGLPARSTVAACPAWTHPGHRPGARPNSPAAFRYPSA